MNSLRKPYTAVRWTVGACVSVLLGVSALIAGGCNGTTPTSAATASNDSTAASASQAPLSTLQLSAAPQSDVAAINNYLIAVGQINRDQKTVSFNAQVAISRLAKEGHHSVEMTDHITDQANQGAQEVVRSFYAVPVPATCKAYADLYSSGLQLQAVEIQSYANVLTQSGAGNSTTTAATALLKSDAKSAAAIAAKFSAADKELKSILKNNPGTQLPMSMQPGRAPGKPGG